MRRQFAFRKAYPGTDYEIGLIRDDNQFYGIATAEQQSWANDIVVALNHYDFTEAKEKKPGVYRGGPGTEDHR